MLTINHDDLVITYNTIYALIREGEKAILENNKRGDGTLTLLAAAYCALDAVAEFCSDDDDEPEITCVDKEKAVKTITALADDLRGRIIIDTGVDYKIVQKVAALAFLRDYLSIKNNAL